MEIEIKNKKTFFWRGFILTLMLFSSFFIFTFEANAAIKTWDGGGGDNKWSTAANWSGDTVPINADEIVFNSTSTKNCTVDNIGAVWWFNKLDITSGYTGTIILSVALVTGPTTIAGGTFNTNGAAFYPFDFSQTGGTFTAGASTITFSGNFSNTGGTFTAGTSTLIFTGSGKTISSTAALTFYNLTINPGSGNTVYLNSNETINGNLKIDSGILNINGSGVELNFLTVNASSTATIDSGSYISGTGTLILATFSFLGSTYYSPKIINNGTINPANVKYSVGCFWSASGTTISIKDNTNGAITFGDGSVATDVLLVGTFGAATNNSDWIYSLGDDVTIKGDLTFSNSAGSSFPGLELDTNGYDLDVGGDLIIGDDEDSLAQEYIFTGDSGDLNIDGDLTILEGDTETTTFTAPSGTGSSAFTLGGDYSNAGTFTHNSGTLTLNGTAKQTLSGTMTSTSAFSNLTITNNSGTSATGFERTSWVPSVDFDAAATVVNDFNILTNHVRVEYNSGSTYTIGDINWSGGSGTDMIYFRNSAESGSWLLNVSGTQTAVGYINVSRSDASSGDEIDASDGTNYDANNNTNWDFGSGGALTFDIVNASGVSVASPSFTFLSRNFAWTSGGSLGYMGTSSQKLRVTNSRKTKDWSLDIAATSGIGSLWESTDSDYDFNGSFDEGILFVSPDAETAITPESGCPTTGLSVGALANFEQGVTDSITILSASSSAYTNCYWDLTGLALWQIIPKRQPAGSYSIGMTLTAS